MSKVFKPKTYVLDVKESKKISDNPKRYVPVCWDIWDPLITIEYDKTYEEDINKLGPETKKIIKSLIKDIKNGYIYVDSPNNKNSDTHFLYEPSSKGKVLYYNKAINTSSDRLTYGIVKRGENLVVRILSCLGHKMGKGPEKSYSEKN